MANDPIDEKKTEKLKRMGISWKEYLKAVLFLFITVTICSYIALNLIFVGYVPAEIIFPTIPCMPPYMSNTPPNCALSINLKQKNEDSVMEKEKSLYKKCGKSDFSKKWKDKKTEDVINLIDNVQQSNKKVQSWEYGSATEYVNAHGTKGADDWFSPIRFFKLTLPLLLARTFIDTRKALHTLHNVCHGIFKDGPIKFGILLIILITLMMNNVLFATIGGLWSIVGIMTVIFFIINLVWNHPWTIPFSLGAVIAIGPWAALWIMRDFIYHYFVMFIFNSKVRTILSCKLTEYWPIISTIFVFFALLKASIYLDSATVTSMWIVYIILLIMNRKKIIRTGGSVSNCEGTKIFKEIDKTIMDKVNIDSNTKSTPA